MTFIAADVLKCMSVCHAMQVSVICESSDQKVASHYNVASYVAGFFFLGGGGGGGG